MKARKTSCTFKINSCYFPYFNYNVPERIQLDFNFYFHFTSNIQLKLHRKRPKYLFLLQENCSWLWSKAPLFLPYLWRVLEKVTCCFGMSEIACWVFSSVHVHIWKLIDFIHTAQNCAKVPAVHCQFCSGIFFHLINSAQLCQTPVINFVHATF